MPRTLGTVCHATRAKPTPRSPAAHIWISDDILSDTFNSFVRHHRRRISNVPGPLEAHKRATKRKLTSSRRVEFGGLDLGLNSFGLFDPTGLLSSQPTERWWNNSESTHAVPQQSKWKWRIWDWWKPASRVSVEETPTPTVEVDERARARDVLMHRLAKAEPSMRTCSALLRLIDQLSVPLAHDPHLAREILALIINHKWPLDEIANVLLEPRLNPAGSSNHVFILKQAAKELCVVRYVLDNSLIVKATKLGLVTVEDLRDVFRLQARLPSKAFTKPLDRTAFCLDMLAAIRASGVLAVEDLGKEFLQEWLLAIEKQNFRRSTIELLWPLCIARDSCPRTALTRLIVTSLCMVNQRTLPQLSWLVEFMLTQPRDVVQESILETTLSLMRQDPTDPAQASAPEYTQSTDSRIRKGIVDLIQHSLSTNAGPEVAPEKLKLPNGKRAPSMSLDGKPAMLEIWYAVLANLGAPRASPFSMSKSGFHGWIHASEPHANVRKRCQSALWTAMALSVQDDGSLGELSSRDFEHAIRASYTAESQRREEDILAVFISDLAESGLPARNRLLKRLTKLSGGFLQVWRNHEALQALLHDVQANNVKRLCEASFYLAVKTHFPRLLRRSAEAVNSNLAKFEEMCLVSILEIKNMVKLAFRLLQHNQELKFALRAARTTTAGRDGPAASERVVLGGFTHARIVEMMDKLAWACATTRQLSDRNAWRKVLWLYRYTGHGLITSRMRRALWHAAAVRPAQPNDGNVQWVYHMIREAEGSRTAAALAYWTTRCRADRESLLNAQLSAEPDGKCPVGFNSSPFAEPCNEAKQEPADQAMLGRSMLSIPAGAEEGGHTISQPSIGLGRKRPFSVRKIQSGRSNVARKVKSERKVLIRRRVTRCR